MGNRVQFTLDYLEDIEETLNQKFPGLVDYRILSEALDARGANRGKKPRVSYVVECIKAGESFSEYREDFKDLGEFEQKPIIIGAGPAGLFCALRLAEYGIPSILIERGERAHKRMLHIAKFWRYGVFDPENNVCFGEGGAGLFSDGKLITRIKSPYVSYVMNKLVDFGAPKETAYVSNPHLGSNKIRQLINKISDNLISHKCEIHYNTRVDEILFSGKQATGVKLADGRILNGQHIILATGHSAKETYKHLEKLKVAMKPKDFAVGVRVEHKRELIDRIQYGEFAKDPKLGAARYRLSWHDQSTDKGSYSFCMCPGGYVLSSGTDADGLVVNGMSNYARNSPWSNAALVVSVKAEADYSVESVLGGLDFQTQIERTAFNYSKEHATGREIPAQNLKDFLKGSIGKKLPKSSCPSGLVSSDLGKILPNFVTDHLRRALLKFDEKLNGFINADALLLAPETRTSAPVTILRDRETLESTSHTGLYPCGEGAGHAGGITSAAVDGVKVAMSLIKKIKEYEGE